MAAGRGSRAPLSSFHAVGLLAGAKYLKFLLLVVILRPLWPLQGNTDAKKKERQSGDLCVWLSPVLQHLSFHRLTRMSLHCVRI